MQKGDSVKIYDGDLIGWTTGELLKCLDKNRWIIKTKEGYMLNRIIKDSKKCLKDGSGYLIK